MIKDDLGCFLVNTQQSGCRSVCDLEEENELTAASFLMKHLLFSCFFFTASADASAVSLHVLPPF